MVKIVLIPEGTEIAAGGNPSGSTMGMRSETPAGLSAGEDLMVTQTGLTLADESEG